MIPPASEGGYDDLQLVRVDMIPPASEGGHDTSS